MEREILFTGMSDFGVVRGSFVKNASGCFIETESGERYRVRRDSVREFTGVVDGDGVGVFEGDLVGKPGEEPAGIVKRHPDGYFYIDRHFGERDDEAAECEFRVLGAEFAIRSGRDLRVVGGRVPGMDSKSDRI